VKPIIWVEHVSKKYSRNANAHLSYGLKDLVSEIFGRNGGLALRDDEFLAVDDISFHLYPGSSFALIGRNGSGKTTLLKMMNGLVKPDAGSIAMEGRVQGLINLGAGFNGALSGRENIYNSASLMGFNSKETRKILDEIVDFAELDEFIDSPVGTYSSGMKARLGFSVAIHLRPDILLIDEILAVGDYGFRNKCFVKMQELKERGVTIVLVSHAHTQVIQLCENALWLDRGKLRQVGPAQETVQAYLDFLEAQEVRNVEKANESRRERPTEPRAAELLYGPIYDEFDRIENLEFDLLVNGKPASSVNVHDEVTIEYAFRLKESVSDLNVSLCFFAKDGTKMSTLSTLNGDLLKPVTRGEVRCRVRIPDFNLNPGTYVIVMPVHAGRSYLYRAVVREFAVTSGGRLTWEMVDFRYEYDILSPSDFAGRRSYL
jgi:ABC-type polysaccharide/polyol phosphate transport system ATPase subunit